MKFFELEEIVYGKHQKYRATENYFLVNGTKINRFLDLEGNSIKDGDVIVMNQVDNDDDE